MVSVTVLMALVRLTGTLPKATVAADSAVGAIPVPVTVIFCGLLLALVVMVTPPAGVAPNAVGVNVTPMVQATPAASVPGLAQVVEGSMA